MIGQVKLQEQLSTLIEDDKFPRFSIFIGAPGSGRKTLANCIYDKLAEEGFGKYVLEDIKIESVRKMIDAAYKMRNTFFYIFDADSMSVAARNALLKVVEECPNNNYFWMTLEDENNTLPTIRSRAQIYPMDRYTPDEIDSYFQDKYDGKEEEKLVCDLCETLGEVDIFEEMGVLDFYEYVERVVDNIAEVSGSNSFKIAEKIALKDEEDKYNLRLFWKIFSKICSNRAVHCFENKEDQQGIQYLLGARITSEALRSLKIKGVNKQMLFDTWILDIRAEWM